MRQVVLDTETTGLEPEAGHRIIEIGCVELVNRRLTSRRFHRYVNPGRPVDRAAVDVHGIEDDFLAKQPGFGSRTGSSYPGGMANSSLMNFTKSMSYAGAPHGILVNCISPGHYIRTTRSVRDLVRAPFG